MASPAFFAFDKTTQAKLTALKPTGGPTATFDHPHTTNVAYQFKIFLPWESLPPLQNLELHQLKINLSIESGSRHATKAVFSTISPNHDTLTITLPQKRPYHITTCEYNLQPTVISFERHSALTPAKDAGVYYVPSQNLNLQNTITVNNEAIAYQYKTPDPNTLSPIAFNTPFWQQTVTTHQTVCGPSLAYKNNTQITHSSFIVEKANPTEIKALNEMGWLLQAGPRFYYSYFGAGAGGSDVRVSFRLYYIDEVSGKISSALELEDSFVLVAKSQEPSAQIGIQVSADFGKIDHFWKAHNASEWTQKSYCASEKGKTYTVCESESIKIKNPPTHPLVVPASFLTNVWSGPHQE